MTERIDYGDEGGVLTYVKEGMVVYDAEDEEIGEVETVYFGSQGVENEADVGPGTVATGDVREAARADTWMHRLANLLELEPNTDIPESVAERLLRRGFIRIDSDRLLGADRFVMPDQIESVSEEGVYLNVNEDDLIKNRW
ncbi:MAG TPA: hypothetical protein VK879_20675 [Candidatus Sulfomarinibacteraceae bacterium]|nr:hypothetical protein [Candidatus Sulfomarinibacteraceae bacterium]